MNFLVPAGSAVKVALTGAKAFSMRSAHRVRLEDRYVLIFDANDKLRALLSPQTLQGLFIVRAEAKPKEER